MKLYFYIIDMNKLEFVEMLYEITNFKWTIIM